MKYAIVLGAFGALLIRLGSGTGWWGFLSMWAGAAFLIVAAGYLGLGPGVFGKRPDGSLGMVQRLLLLPYLLLIEALWRLQRPFLRGPACHEVAPGVWLGRRPALPDLPSGVSLVIDLTCEFPATRLPKAVQYRSLPCLDGAAPEAAAFTEAADLAAACEGPVYIHCALGHGRSAALAAAVLFARGLAASAEEAERYLARLRPGVALCAAQRRVLADYCHRRSGLTDQSSHVA